MRDDVCMNVEMGEGRRNSCGCRNDYRSKNEFSGVIASNKYHGTIDIKIREKSAVDIYEIEFKLDIKTARQLNKLLTNHLHDHDILVLEKRQEVEEAKSLLEDKENELDALINK